MTIPFLSYFKRSKGNVAVKEAPPKPVLPPIEKPSSERFSKTVMPNATRTLPPQDPFEMAARSTALGGQMPSVATAMAPDWIPVRLLLSQKFDSLEKIARVRMPVFIAHGASDRLIPSRFSSALFAAAHEPKKLLLVDGASHNNTMIVGASEYLAGLLELFGLPVDAQPHAPVAYDSPR